MKFLFVSGLKHLPQAFGGVQSNAHEMALELQRRGHDVCVAAALEPHDRLGVATRLKNRLLPSRAVFDKSLGYPVFRRWEVREALSNIVQTTRPDIAVLQPSEHLALAHELIRLGIPTLVYFHDVLFDELEGDPRELKEAHFLANSEFTARRCREEFGLSTTVINPIFQAERYRTKPRWRSVTMINPIPVKGGEVALRLAAACPDIPFRLVPSWRMSPDQRDSISTRIKSLPNVTLARPTMNTRRIYAEAKVLLAPSILGEAWGRVVSEAHFSGIPVLASNRGGLPEAVGPGGVVLDPEGPLEPWIEALRRMWTDDAYFADLSAAARAYSKRPQMNPAAQVELMVRAARAAIAGQPAAARELGASPDAPSPDPDLPAVPSAVYGFTR